MKMKQSNNNVFAVLQAKLNSIAGSQGKVGWFENAKYEDGTPVAGVAMLQEYGSAKMNIPPRSFMRITVAEKQKNWGELAASGANAILKGNETPASVLAKLTIQAQNDVSEKISSITAPPLSQITLGARKYRQEGKKVTGATIGQIARELKAGTLDVSGVSTKPLEDTGYMSATLTHIVEKI